MHPHDRITGQGIVYRNVKKEIYHRWIILIYGQYQSQLVDFKHMKINDKSGLLEDALQIPSENFDERPACYRSDSDCAKPAEEQNISLIVVHNISLPPGEFGGPYIAQLFTNTLNPDEHPYFADIHQLKVSSHVLIRRNADIIQFVPFQKRAWHAGVSAFCGREACNDFSIGIELEGTDDIPYEKAQYETLAKLIISLQQSYPTLPKDAITGHCDIAPGRKTDPGPAFDWAYLHTLISQHTSQNL